MLVHGVGVGRTLGGWTVSLLINDQYEGLLGMVFWVITDDAGDEEPNAIH